MRIRPHAVAGLLTSLVAAWLTVGGVSLDDVEGGPEKAPKPVKVKARMLPERRLCHYGASTAIPVDGSFQVGPHRVGAAASKQGVVLAWQDGEKQKRVVIPRRGKGKTLKLGSGAAAIAVHVFRDDTGRLFFMNPAVLSARIGRLQLLFWDADFDGVYFEPGEDWYGLPDATYALPFENPLLLAREQVRLLDLDVGKPAFRAEVRPLAPTLSAEETTLLGTLNEARLASGLMPVEVDPLRSTWCRRHAQYMQATGTWEHSELQGHRLYTPEGDRAARNGLVTRASSPARALFDFLDTPLHGYAMGCPSFSWTALGYEGGFAALWFRAAQDKPWKVRAARFPAVFPPNLARGVPLSWRGEVPDPRAGQPAPGTLWGYPIRIYLRAEATLKGAYPTDVQLAVTHAGSGDPVPCQIVSSPDDTTLPDHGGWIQFLVLPRVVLEAGTRYRLQGSWTYEGKPTTWDSTFETGTLHGQGRAQLER